jgi:hypothetical protein
MDVNELFKTAALSLSLREMRITCKKALDEYRRIGASDEEALALVIGAIPDGSAKTAILSVLKYWWEKWKNDDGSMDWENGSLKQEIHHGQKGRIPWPNAGCRPYDPQF